MTPVLERGLSVPRQPWSDAAAPLFPCLHQGQLKGPEGLRSWGSLLPVPPIADVTPAQDASSHIPTPWGPRVPRSDLSSLILGLLGPWDPSVLLSSLTVGLHRPLFALISAPPSTAVFAFSWHPVLSKQSVGTDEQLAGSSLCSPQRGLCNKNVEPV